MAGRDHSRSPGGPGDLIHAASWIEGEVVFEHRRFAAPRADHRSFSSSGLSHHRFVLTEAGETSRTRVLIGGRTIYDGADCPGAVSFMPALSERTSSYLGRRSALLVPLGLACDQEQPPRVYG